jgi:hypothetical protein
VNCIWIGNQKVILFLKFGKNQREAAARSLIEEVSFYSE